MRESLGSTRIDSSRFDEKITQYRYRKVVLGDLYIHMVILWMEAGSLGGGTREICARIFDSLTKKLQEDDLWALIETMGVIAYKSLIFCSGLHVEKRRLFWRV